MSWRHEKKWVVQEENLKGFPYWFRMHPAHFHPSYPDRWVNNLYFDTPELESFQANLDGDRDRVKVRIRSYGTFLGEWSRPVLELKLKRGLLGTKRIFSLPSFSPWKFHRSVEWDAFWCSSGLPEELRISLKRYRPILFNRYLRSYWETLGGRARLTGDRDLRFWLSSDREGKAGIPLGLGVLEMKYPEDQVEGQEEKILNRFPLRVTRMSKYANGVSLLGLARLE